MAYALSEVYIVLAWVGLYLGVRYYRELQAEVRRANQLAAAEQQRDRGGREQLALLVDLECFPGAAPHGRFGQ